MSVRCPSEEGRRKKEEGRRKKEEKRKARVLAIEKVLIVLGIAICLFGAIAL
jgi:hypothetical protein